VEAEDDQRSGLRGGGVERSPDQVPDDADQRQGDPARDQGITDGDAAPNAGSWRVGGELHHPHGTAPAEQL